MTGKAMVLAGDTVFVAGAPIVFPLDDLAGTYAGRRGALLPAVSAKDGSKLAEYTMDKLPAWDGIAAAYGRLFMTAASRAGAGEAFRGIVKEAVA
jgi:hypothetical protein